MLVLAQRLKWRYRLSLMLVLPDRARLAAAITRYQALREFRARLYECLTARADACFELCDAILCAGHAARPRTPERLRPRPGTPLPSPQENRQSQRNRHTARQVTG
jgi:hypothetical protein